MPVCFTLWCVRCSSQNLVAPFFTVYAVDLDLARSRTARHALIGEGGVNRTRLRTGVRVIQVVMGVASVKKNGLLDQPLPKDLRQEIYVFLGSRCTNGDVVEARYQGHVALPPARLYQEYKRLHKTPTNGWRNMGSRVTRIEFCFVSVVSIYQGRALHATWRLLKFAPNEGHVFGGGPGAVLVGGERRGVRIRDWVRLAII